MMAFVGTYVASENQGVTTLQIATSVLAYMNESMSHR